MSEWRTIDTAPKDGTRVLIFEPSENVVLSSFWIAQPGTLNNGAWYGADPMHRLNWCQYPTHWMPVPPPPELIKVAAA